MVGGFSFCGVDIAVIGLQYAPDNANTYVYKPAHFTVQEESFDGHNGGFYYGATRKPKDFILRCFYESKNINNGIMSEIHTQFKIGRSGQLVFEKNPWLYYYATVIDVDTSQMFNFLNGCIVVKMRAYYPFARTDLSYIKNNALDDYSLANNSALLKENVQLPDVDITKGGNIIGQKSFLLYNAGTERAAVSIQVAGEASGVTIANATTNQSCKFVGLSKADTTDSNKYVLLDGINGKTLLVDKTTKSAELAFRFHDYGFIDLEPAFPVIRDVKISFQKGSQEQIANFDLSADHIGRYISIKGVWHKIININKNKITVSVAMTGTGSEVTVITTMNEITVTPDSDTSMDLSLLNFVYKHTFF